ncbi:MAG: DUF2461 domain-containing protein [Spirochaetia bacterium]|nr:DUF2461 domain-containing protein [Spirochaetia bacterium]
MLARSTIDFLRALKKNNTREWFKGHEEDYRAAVTDFTRFVDVLIAKTRKLDNSIGNVSARDCLFRIFRDVRFSRNKSPYKTNFGAFIAAGGKKSTLAGYYFHLEPGACFLGGGLYMPDPKRLALVRTAIETDPGPLRKILAAKSFKSEYEGLSGDRVKTAPRGFSKDHPDLDLIQFKSYTAVAKLEDKALAAKDLDAIIVKRFAALYPLNAWLNKVLTKK